MAVLDILVHPAAVLKQQAVCVRRFDTDLEQFVENLQDTLQAAPGCVGIAAPQVGHSVQIIIVDVPVKKQRSAHGRLVMINPEIVEREGNVAGREGCLSVPDYTGNVMRAERITVNAADLAGEISTYAFEGFEARVVQHEIDHLNGLLFLDRLVSRRSDLFRRKVYK